MDNENQEVENLPLEDDENPEFPLNDPTMEQLTIMALVELEEQLEKSSQQDQSSPSPPLPDWFLKASENI